jgi:hypothetical protein
MSEAEKERYIMTWKDYIAVNDFPPLYQDIVSVIGLSKTVALTGVFSSMNMYLRKLTYEEFNKPLRELPEDYQLCFAAIGRDATKLLADRFEGMQLNFIAREKVYLPAKIRYIRANFNGKNHKTLAINTRLSLGYVYSLLRGAERKNEFI